MEGGEEELERGGDSELTDDVQSITTQQGTSRCHTTELGRADTGLVGSVAGLDRRSGFVGACLLDISRSA